MKRISGFQERSKVDYAAASEINGYVRQSKQAELALLTHETAAVQTALEGLQSDLTRDFRAELGVIDKLVEIQEIFETLLLITVIAALLMSVRAFTDSRLSAQQQKLDDERKILRALIDNIPDFMFVKDAEGRFVIANAHTASTLGVASVEELLGKTSFDLFPEELAKAYTADDLEIMGTGQPLFNREEKGVDHRGNSMHLRPVRSRCAWKTPGRLRRQMAAARHARSNPLLVFGTNLTPVRSGSLRNERRDARAGTDDYVD
jgi:PAS domain S-box-containing protein